MEPRATEAQFAELLVRMRQMSAADVSLLDASLNTPDCNITTAPGSRNEALLSKMVTLGWMARREEALDLPGGKRFVMKIYSITPQGQDPIATLLSMLEQS